MGRGRLHASGYRRGEGLGEGDGSAGGGEAAREHRQQGRVGSPVGSGRRQERGESSDGGWVTRVVSGGEDAVGAAGDESTRLLYDGLCDFLHMRGIDRLK